QSSSAEKKQSHGPGGGESISGLRGPLVKEFVTTIQPILLSRCGDVKCHQSNRQVGFQLERVRTGSGFSRVATSKNLESALAQIDGTSPGKSPLLDRGLSPHGGRLVSQFSGVSGVDQQRR